MAGIRIGPVRAGNTGNYCYGDDVSELGGYSWYDANSKGTHPVAWLMHNAWGLYDMHGNVWEWVSDRYGAYPTGPVTDPSGPSTGSMRVVRGGSWFLDAGSARSAARSDFVSGFRGVTLGFRLARCAAP